MSSTPQPSGTLVLVRDARESLELLLLQRAPRDGKPGAWVFPGGRVDPTDAAGAPHPHEPEYLARRAAIRETHEEAGLRVEPAGLVTIARWITPDLSPRRFDTWFFLSPTPDPHDVRVDDTEICAFRWIAPDAALAAQRSGELGLAPPTFVTLSWLCAYRRAAQAIDALGRAPTLTFRPRICPLPDGKSACMLYPGDAGYEQGDPDKPGPRHRLWAEPAGYRYERST